MTKHVRIENADMSDWQVKVEMYERSAEVGAPDRLVRTAILRHPTDMDEAGITSSRYLVISEMPPEAPMAVLNTLPSSITKQLDPNYLAPAIPTT